MLNDQLRHTIVDGSAAGAASGPQRLEVVGVGQLLGHPLGENRPCIFVQKGEYYCK